MEDLTKSPPVRKSFVVLLIVIGIGLGTLPVFFSEMQELSKGQPATENLTIKPYPGLTWSQPKEGQVLAIFNQNSEQEEVTLSEGQTSSAESEKNVSQEVFDYFDQSLESQGFSQIILNGDPREEVYWVSSYQKDKEYVEVQYNPTPYKEGSFTSTIFYGLLEKEEE